MTGGEDVKVKKSNSGEKKKSFLKEHRLQADTLTFKWIKNFVFTSSALLLVIFVVFAVSIKNYYYNSAQMKLQSAHYSMVNEYFSSLNKDEESFALGAETFVKNFADKDVIEVETYLRTLLEDMFLNEFNFKFNSIEFKVTALVPKYKADKEAIDAAVLKKLEEIKAEKQEDTVSEETEAAREELAEETEVPVDEETPEEAVLEEPVQEVEPADEVVEAVETEEAEEKPVE